MPATAARRRLTIVGAAIVVVLLVVVGGPFIYIHFFAGSTPAKLTISSADTAGGTSTTVGAETVPLTGTWKVTKGSTAGYRVDEVLFGQTTVAVGRTSSVTGQMVITGTKMTSASFTVDMTTIHSNKTQRDQQFQGPIMDTADFPHATFETTAPIALPTDPPNGQTITVQATGELTLHGRANQVTVPLTARRTGNTIDVAGSIPVTFADYGIPNPSQSFVTTQNHGTVEFLLVFGHA